MDEKLFAQFKKLVSEKLDVSEDKINIDSKFREDLNADSLDTYELIYAIDEEFGVSVPDEKANSFETVRDAFEFLESQL